MKSFNDIEVNENGTTELGSNTWQCKYWDMDPCRALVLNKGDFVIEVRPSGRQYVSRLKLDSWNMNFQLQEFKGDLLEVVDKVINAKPVNLKIGDISWYRSHDDDHHEHWSCVQGKGGAELDYFKKTGIEKTGYFAATLHLSKGEMDFSLSCNRLLSSEFSEGSFAEAAKLCLTLDEFLQKEGALLIA